MPSSIPVWSRRAVALAAALVVALGPGCRTIDLDAPQAESRGLTIEDATATHLGQAWSAQAVADGESGFRLLSDSLEAFAARVRMADVAERTLDLQYYILSFDQTGSAILARVAKAADRGVRVRILIDDMYAKESERKLAALDLHPNIDVRLWNPWRNRGAGRGAEFLFDGRLNHRMHNKLFAADSTAVVLGGRNIADEYFDLHNDFAFRDIDVLGVGPVARDATDVFDAYWNDASAVPLAGQRSIDVREADLEELRDTLGDAEEELKTSAYADSVRNTDLLDEIRQVRVRLIPARYEVVADPPSKVGSSSRDDPTHLAATLRDDVASTESELVVSSPYFVPRSAGTATLLKAARRGVRIRVLTNSLAATDVGVVHASYSRYRLPLVKGGVELYELRPLASGARPDSERAYGSANASLHAKSFVIDGRSAFVGSLNLDPRSFRWNTEIGVLIHSEELAAEVQREIERLMSPSTAYRLVEDPNRGLEWIGESDGEEVRIHHEPDTTWWRRFTTGFLGIFPIEGQV